MKLDDIMESQMATVKKNGLDLPIYKNPTKEELEKISLHGVSKGFLTTDSFIGFDFKNLSFNDMPKVNGYPVVIYFIGGDNIDVELVKNFGHSITDEKFKELLSSNAWIKKYFVHKLVYTNETE
jgi:hypothetical protein